MKRQKRLLVVDDDPSVRTMLKRVLAEEGYHVQSATNGAAAKYRVTWGAESAVFTREQLERGINLAAEFPKNDAIPNMI